MNLDRMNENRPPVMADVEKIMASLRPASTANKPVYGINMLRIMQAQNNNLPRFMYHESLAPQLAISEDQVTELAQIGYVEHYIRQAYPKTIYRRNKDPKFAEKIDKSTGMPMSLDYIEERTVRNADAEASLKKMKIPASCGPWVDKITEIEPLVEFSEDPEITIARLEGELKAKSNKAA